jgi:PadR family transcriptional regulator PadR
MRFSFRRAMADYACGGPRRPGKVVVPRDTGYNANPSSIMGNASPIVGEVEMLVLLAVLRLGDDAYAVPIRALVKREAGVDLSRGTIYVTLERLERKGYVTSWFSDPQAVRGGKARRIFRLKPAGVQAAKLSKRGIDRLAAGTELEAKPAGKRA